MITGHAGHSPDCKSQPIGWEKGVELPTAPTDFTEEVAKLREENAALKAEVERLRAGWQPIETAPKGERILVFNGKAFAAQWVKHPGTGHEAWQVAQFDPENGLNLIEPPTHWMPLPAPPKEGD